MARLTKLAVDATLPAMSSETKGVTIRDALCAVVLHPAHFYDHGLTHRVDLVAGQFQGWIKATAYADPYLHFHRDLRRFYDGQLREVSLGDVYDSLKLQMTSDGLGHIEVKVWAVADHLRPIHLNFGIFFDQTFLPPIIRAIDETFLQVAKPSR